MIVAEVGKRYRVPCLFVQPSRRAMWMPRDGWVPVIGPKHADAEHLAFPHEHYHVDWRFIGSGDYMYAAWRGPAHGNVITGDTVDEGIHGTPELKLRKCHRAMPDFPSRRGKPEGKRWAGLEQAFQCSRLKPGNICPHRGIDLTPFAKSDGTAVCPGHGLRWNLLTGESLPHHSTGLESA